MRGATYLWCFNWLALGNFSGAASSGFLFCRLSLPLQGFVYSGSKTFTFKLPPFSNMAFLALRRPIILEKIKK